MVANACDGCHQCGGNHLVVGPAPMAVAHGLTARSCLIPVLRRLRKEMDATAFDLEKPVVDVTPWHQQVRNAWQQPLGRPWGSGWGSAGDRDPDRRQG